MKHDSRTDTERAIVETMGRLDPEQVAQVLDFVEFLAEKKRHSSPVMDLLRESATGPKLSIEDVRASLATIKGQVSDTVREQRDERG